MKLNIFLLTLSMLIQALDNSSKTPPSLKMLAFKIIERKTHQSLKGAKGSAMIHHLKNGDFDELIPHDFLMQAPQYHATAKRQLDKTDNHLFFPKYAGDFLIDDRKWQSLLPLKVYRSREFYIHNFKTNKSCVLESKVDYRLKDAYDICNQYCAYISTKNGETLLNIQDLSNESKTMLAVSTATYDGGFLQFINSGRALCRGYKNVLEFYDSSSAKLIRKKSLNFTDARESIYDIYEIANDNLLLKTLNSLNQTQMVGSTNKNDYLNWHYYTFDTKTSNLTPILVSSSINIPHPRICAISPEKSVALWHGYNQSKGVFILQNLTNTSECTEIPTHEAGPVIANFMDSNHVAIIQYPQNFVFGSRHHLIKTYCLNIANQTKSKLIASNTVKTADLMSFMPSTFNHYGNLEFISLRERRIKALVNQIDERIFKPADYMPTKEQQIHQVNELIAKHHARNYFADNRQ